MRANGEYQYPFPGIVPQFSQSMLNADQRMLYRQLRDHSPDQQIPTPSRNRHQYLLVATTDRGEQIPFYQHV